MNFLRSAARRLTLVRLASFVFLFCVGTTASLAQVSVLTQKNDTSRTGQNLNETYLTPSLVNATHFGPLFTQAVDGFVVAEPLYVPNLQINGATHNVVFVVTLHDGIYAFDADSSTGDNASPLWYTSLIDPPNVTTVPIADQGCPANGYSEMGILGTPVIDPTTNTMYLVAKTLENGNYIFRLHALNILTGQESLGGPVEIQASYTSDGQPVTFAVQHRMQRPALLLSNGVIYIAFGNMGCIADPPSTGWLMAYQASNLDQIAVLDVGPRENAVPGIWMSGDGPSVDSSGNVYLVTGDGEFDYNLGGLDFGDTVLKLNLENGNFGLVDYFTPYNQSQLDQDDLDLGSSGLMLLPPQAGPNPNLGLVAGKAGEIYLVNQDSLGGYNSVVDQVVQEFPFNPNQSFVKIFGAASYWNNMVYFGASNSPIQAYGLSNGLLTTTPIAQTANTYNFATLFSTSSNGTQNGILWALEQIRSDSLPRGSLLQAFNATTLQSLYSSWLSAATHLSIPMVANGKVYVGTQTSLAVFGLFPGIQPTGGNGQTGQVGTKLPIPLRVAVGNAYTKEGVPGVTVNFSDGGEGGKFSNPFPTTDAEGIAGTTYTLPPNAGTVTIKVIRQGYVTGYFTETAVSDSAAR